MLLLPLGVRPLAGSYPQGTFRNIWRHIWLSQLGQYCWHLVGGSQGWYQTYYNGHSPTTKNFQAQHIHCVAVEEKICSRFLKGASIYSGTPCVSVPYPVTIKYLNKIDIHCLSSCALTCVSQPSARINGIKL